MVDFYVHAPEGLQELDPRRSSDFLGTLLGPSALGSQRKVWLGVAGRFPAGIVACAEPARTQRAASSRKVSTRGR